MVYKHVYAEVEVVRVWYLLFIRKDQNKEYLIEVYVHSISIYIK